MIQRPLHYIIVIMYVYMFKITVNKEFIIKNYIYGVTLVLESDSDSLAIARKAKMAHRKQNTYTLC